MSKFVIPKENFVNHFITPLSKFDLVDKSALVTLNKNILTGITYTEDREVVLEAKLKNVKGDDLDDPVTFKDLNRMLFALKYINESMLTCDVQSNHLLYEDDEVKFKSYFLENKFFDSKIVTKLKKIYTLPILTNFTLSQANLSKIKQSKQFTSDTDKVYLSAGKDGIFASRHDTTKPRIDTIKFNIGSEFKGNPFDDLSLSIKIFDLISDKTNDILIELNADMGFIRFTIDTTDFCVKYTAQALRN